MRLVQPEHSRRRGVFAPEALSDEITAEDEQRFLNVVSTELSADQIARVISPPTVYPDQEEVLGIHWHP
jgi:hypothetical protein